MHDAYEFNINTDMPSCSKPFQETRWYFGYDDTRVNVLEQRATYVMFFQIHKQTLH